MFNMQPITESDGYKSKISGLDEMLRKTQEKIDAKNAENAKKDQNGEDTDESPTVEAPSFTPSDWNPSTLAEKIKSLLAIEIKVSKDDAMAVYDKNKDGIVSGAELGFSAGGAFNDMSTGMPSLSKLKGQN